MSCTTCGSNPYYDCEECKRYYRQITNPDYIEDIIELAKRYYKEYRAVMCSMKVWPVVEELDKDLEYFPWLVDEEDCE